MSYQQFILAVSSYPLRALPHFYGYVIFPCVDLLYYIQLAGHWVVSDLLLLQYCGELACILSVDKSADISVGQILRDRIVGHRVHASVIIKILPYSPCTDLPSHQQNTRGLLSSSLSKQCMIIFLDFASQVNDISQNHNDLGLSF